MIFIYSILYYNYRKIEVTIYNIQVLFTISIDICVVPENAHNYNPSPTIEGTPEGCLTPRVVGHCIIGFRKI